ncbi:Multicopper oxidase with three cupredoxin domains (includes cell division protein FtsP and spore coat protein CotA) [Rhizobiales bacterium GAS191]|nr:Multicopper oxidase with three cupredoxin domains (includes cell division protein FtsP and spore coat protein CotA) [Rhizobiales bacterium GAS191]
MAVIGAPVRAGAGEAPRVRGLRAAAANWSLRPPPAAASAILSYDDTVPGPVIFARQGDEIALDLENKLANPTSFHIAGMRLPNALDGIPGLSGKAIASLERAELRIPARDAGFFTFGPADPASAAEQSGRGLGGVLIVADPKDPDVEADTVLVLRDWRLDPSGALEDSFGERALRAGSGRLGNVFTIGGLGEKRLLSLAPGARFRVRIANACNARILPLRFEGMHPTLIGVSGQQSAAFTPLHGEMLLVPGARFDLVCDIPGDARPGEGRPEPQIRAMIGEGFPLLGVALSGEPVRRGEPAPVAWLSDNGLPEIVDLRRSTRIDLRVTRSVDPANAQALAGADAAKLWALNGKSGSLSAPPLFSVKRGTPVVIATTNTTDAPIVMKLNGHVARLLHPRDDGWVPYWVDVVLVAPNTTERLAFVADNPGRWLFGGRILEHLAGGQFGWFEVT